MELFDNVPPQVNLQKFPTNIEPTTRLQLCKYENSFICKSHKFIVSLEESNTWERFKNLPFQLMPGQSMTNVGTGIAFFGGQADKIQTNELWFYQYDSWVPIVNTIMPRKNHAAAYIPTLSSLLISGGINQKRIISDFSLVNMELRETKAVKLEREIHLAWHSLLFLHDTTVCLVGGYDEKNTLNKSIYIIDIATGSVKQIDSFLPFSPTYPFSISYIDRMLIVTNPPPKSDSWCYDFTYNIWMRLDLSDVLPNALFVVPSENCLTLFDSGMKNYVKATYNDINILKDRIVTHNLNSSLYKFEEEHFDENHKSVLNAQKTALVLLQSVVRNHTQVNESALFQLEIEHDENEIRQLQQSFKKTIKHEESKSKAPKLQKTAFELMEMIQNLKEKQKEESNEHNNNNLALLQTLRSYTFEGFNKTKEINEETLNYFIHMSEEMSKQITEQNQRINQLRKMIETQKNKYGNCLSSLIYAKEQLDLWNTNLNESKSQLSASISRYVDSQIEYNNSLLNEILYPNENTNKKRLLRHEASVLQRQHINHRRSKQAKLNQLNDEIKMLIKQGTSGGQKDGEIMCRQVKTRIIELVEWVNENARGVGSNKELKLNEDSNKGITPTSIRRKVPAMRTRVDSMGNYQNNIESDISSYSKSVILALEELKSLYNLTV